MVKSRSTTHSTKKVSKKVEKVAPQKESVYLKKQVNKVSLNPTKAIAKKSGKLQKIKRYSKQTLRDVLLSRMFHSAFKVIFGVAIVGCATYGAYGFVGKTIGNDVVVSQSEILSRIGKLTALPTGSPDAIVRVQDAESLRSQNSFYERVKEGDYIVMYPTFAVIYDLRNNTIVEEKRNIK